MELFVTPLHSGWLWRDKGYENTLIRQEIFRNYTHECQQWEQEPADHRRIFFLTHHKVSWLILKEIFQFKKKTRKMSQLNSLIFVYEVANSFLSTLPFATTYLTKWRKAKISIAVVNMKWDSRTLKCSQPVNLSIALQASSVFSISSCLLLLSGSSFKILFRSQVKWYTRSLFLRPDR